MNWKKYIVQEDPEPAKPPGPSKQVAELPTTMPWPPTTTSRPTGTVEAAAAARMPSSFAGEPLRATYEDLKAQFSFANTDAGKALERYLAPLRRLPGMDETTMFRAALAQATELDGFQPAKFLATFDGLLTQISAASDADRQRHEHVMSEISARRRRADELEAQLKELRASADNDDRLEQGTFEGFINGANQLASELRQQKNSYANLIGGKK